MDWTTASTVFWLSPRHQSSNFSLLSNELCAVPILGAQIAIPVKEDMIESLVMHVAKNKGTAETSSRLEIESKLQCMASH